MPQVSVAQLFEDNREKLRLAWVAGRDGARKELDSEHSGILAQGPDRPSQLHPPELDPGSRATRRPITFRRARSGSMPVNTLQELAAQRSLCLHRRRDGVRLRRHLCALADGHRSPALPSPLLSVELMWMLRPYLRARLAESSPRHGVFLDVLGMGVLITGDSGVGKSELALELISRGSGLVADDVVELYRIGPETLEGRCPALLRDFLEVRGLGVLNIRTIFGETAVRPRKNLKLIVQLEKPAGRDCPGLERLPLNAGSGRSSGRRDPQGADTGGRRPQPRGAGGGGRAQSRAAAARDRQHARIHPAVSEDHMNGTANTSVASMQLVLVTGLSGSGKSVALNRAGRQRVTIAWTTCRPCCSPDG